MAQRARGTVKTGPNWDQLSLAPIILLSVGEPVLGDWAVDRLVQMAGTNDPSTVVSSLDAATYSAGTLEVLASPSLFSEARMIVIRNAEKMNDALMDDALRYVAHPAEDVVVVIRHGGGNRGKKLLDAIDAARYQHAQIPALRNDGEKAHMVRQVGQALGKRIGQEAVAELVDALGSDVQELVAATRQLCSDVEGDINAADVHTYYGGRKEASGFAVADAVVAGDSGRAIALARHAMATGTPPVPIVAAIAMKLRAMGLAIAARGLADPSETGLAPWQLNRARSELQGWSGEGLARAILAMAQADAEVKGASRDPEFALERAIVRVCRARTIR